MVRERNAAIAAHDAVGPWKISAQELLTGVAAVAEVTLAPNAAPAPSLAAIPEVHVVNESHLRGFLGRAEEKWVIVEPGQSSLLPLAQSLVAKLQAAGVKARLWQVAPEHFDTVPVRWYPRSEDVTRVAEIGRAGLIGYRESLKAFIDTKTRSHVPVRGGYTEIAPHFMVGGDCIVFAGTVGNDQFWRLFPLRPSAAAKLRTIGVHCHAGGRPEGLSEVEVY